MLDQTDPLELLAQDALVPVVFNTPATALGPVMDPGSTERDLPQGTSLSIPLWLVPSLHSRQFVTMRLPSVYTDRFRRKLNAGAEVVSLKSWVRMAVCAVRLHGLHGHPQRGKRGTSACADALLLRGGQPAE
jgi:hypothetical protein